MGTLSTTPPLLSTPPLLTTPPLPMLSPRCTPMRSPPTPTTTPSPMTTWGPTSTLPSPMGAPVLLRDLTQLPFPTAVCSTLPTTPTTSTATLPRSPTTARLSTPRPSLEIGQETPLFFHFCQNCALKIETYCKHSGEGPIFTKGMQASINFDYEQELKKKRHEANQKRGVN